MTLIEKFAEAIKIYEGWFVGSRSQRNHNPGNLKFANQKKAITKDKDGFAIFTCDLDGWDALIWQIQIAISGQSYIYKPDMTILQFFEKYAPKKDSNDPNAYAKFVANYIGKDINFLIKNLNNEIENKEKQLIELLLNGKVIFRKEF